MIITPLLLLLQHFIQFKQRQVEGILFRERALNLFFICLLYSISQLSCHRIEMNATHVQAGTHIHLVAAFGVCTDECRIRKIQPVLPKKILTQNDNFLEEEMSLAINIGK